MSKKPPSPTPREQFAARLRELAEGHSRDELAKAWGVSRSAVQQFLSGKSFPDLNRWPQIAKSLGLAHCRELLDGVQ